MVSVRLGVENSSRVRVRCRDMVGFYWNLC